MTLPVLLQALGLSILASLCVCGWIEYCRYCRVTANWYVYPPLLLGTALLALAIFLDFEHLDLRDERLPARVEIPVGLANPAAAVTRNRIERLP